MIGIQRPEVALVMLVGAPGSGKSTWARKNFTPDQIVSLDGLRGMVSGDPNNQGATPYAVPIMHTLLDGRMYFQQTTVVDSTNYRADVRDEVLRHAHLHGATAATVVLDTPLDVCLARNARRRGTRRVPEDFIRKAHGEIQAALPVESTWIPPGCSFGVWVGLDSVRVGGFVPRWIRSQPWTTASVAA